MRLVLLVEYPYLVKSNYATIDPNLIIADERSNLTVSLLQIEQPLNVQQLESNLTLNPDGRILWKTNGSLDDDESMALFRYYAAVEIKDERHIDTVSKNLYDRMPAVLNLRPTTVKSKLLLSSFTNCANSLLRCTQPLRIVWSNRVAVQLKGDVYVCIVSHVPATSNANGDPMKTRVNLNLSGVPRLVETFSERANLHKTCIMKQEDSDYNKSNYNKLDYNKSNDTCYLSPFFKSTESICFDFMYEMPKPCIRISRNKVVYYNGQVPYYILLSREPYNMPIENDHQELVTLIDTSINIDSHLCVFQRLRFNNVEIHPFGLYAKDEYGNVMYIGLVDKLFNL